MKMKHCAKCILPETMPNISFDKDQVCNYCHTYEPFRYKGEAEFVSLLNRNRDPDKKYECMVAISGGRDSAFTLLKTAKDYKMKVLAVNYENPFTDPQATKNINNMVEALGVDIVRFKHHSNIHEDSLKNNIVAWFKKPSAAMVPMMCIGCKIIWNKILDIANKNGIKMIINGGNPYEYSSYKKEFLGVSRDADLATFYRKFLGGLIKKAAGNYRYLKPKYLPVLCKGYLFANQYSPGSSIRGRGIDRLDMFHYVKWNEREVISRITNELDWDYPRANNSTWRFDCKIGHLKDYMYLKTMGFTEKDDFYAKMIREGMITRDEALVRLSRENRVDMNAIAEIFSILGLLDPIG